MLPAKIPPSQAETNRHPKNHFCRKHQCVLSCKAVSCVENASQVIENHTFLWYSVLY